MVAAYVFTEGGKVSTNVKYEYSDSSTTYPTRIIETGSDGIEHITNLSYPQDYGDIFPYTEMVERNILSPVVKKEHIRNGQYLEVETPYSVPFINVYKPENVVIRRSASEKVTLALLTSMMTTDVNVRRQRVVKKMWSIYMDIVISTSLL